MDTRQPAPVDTNTNRPSFGPPRDNREPPLTQPSPSLDPRNISSIPDYDASTSGYVSAAYDAFTTAHANIQAVIDARNKVNENTAWTEDQRLLRIADFASAKQEAATRALDSAHSRLASGIKSLEESLDKPLEQQAGVGTVNEEIRRHCKSLSDKERGELLANALSEKDAKTIVAVAGAPSYLSGLSKERHTLLTRQWNGLTQGEVVKRLGVMKRALELVDRNGPLVLGQIERALGGKDAWLRIQRAKQRDKAANAALAG
jgi:hypothetical protein